MDFFGLEQIFCDPRVFNSVDRVGNWEEEWANKVADAFEKLISENSKRHLNEIKKKEVSAIRRWVNKVQILNLIHLFLRRLMQGKKNQNQNNSELPTHLDMTVRGRFNLLNLWSVEVFWHQRNDFLESSVHGTRPQDADNGKQQPREVILWETAIFDLIESPPRKFTELRERDFQRYEMEKRFLEEQRLRHIKVG